MPKRGGLFEFARLRRARMGTTGLTEVRAIKVKALNLLALLFAAAVLGIVLLYQFAETFRGSHG